MINNARNFKLSIIILVISYFFVGRSAAQFLDNFDNSAIKLDPRANDGWTYFSGDGSAIMDFQQKSGYASILVDATEDQPNIWWALSVFLT